MALLPRTAAAPARPRSPDQTRRRSRTAHRRPSTTILRLAARAIRLPRRTPDRPPTRGHRHWRSFAAPRSSDRSPRSNLELECSPRVRLRWGCGARGASGERTHGGLGVAERRGEERRGLDRARIWIGGPRPRSRTPDRVCVVYAAPGAGKAKRHQDWSDAARRLSHVTLLLCPPGPSLPTR
jgi:hypothetical protein